MKETTHVLLRLPNERERRVKGESRAAAAAVKERENHYCCGKGKRLQEKIKLSQLHIDYNCSSTKKLQHITATSPPLTTTRLPLMKPILRIFSERGGGGSALVCVLQQQAMRAAPPACSPCNERGIIHGNMRPNKRAKASLLLQLQKIPPVIYPSCPPPAHATPQGVASL